MRFVGEVIESDDSLELSSERSLGSLLDGIGGSEKVTSSHSSLHRGFEFLVAAGETCNVISNVLIFSVGVGVLYLGSFLSTIYSSTGREYAA